MDAKLMEIGVQIRKIMMFSFRTFYRSVCRNPFLVCILLFLIFLYRSFPFLFSLLVSASPVLVSTAVLLGTLLSFGHPNIPEIEKEETITDEIVSLKTGVHRDTLVVEGDRSYPIEKYTKQRDLDDKSIEETSSLANNVSEVDRDDSMVHSSPRREESSREFRFEKRVDEGEERELRDTGFKRKNELNEEKIGDGKGVETQYSLIQQSDNENDESEIDNSPEGSIGSPMGDRLNSSPGLPLKEEEEEEEEEVSDSGSDGDESSSPDASMADIIPMLDELHPLLDEEEATRPAHMSNDGSDADAVSEHSSKSSKSGNESDPDSENHEELEVVEDEEEEETHGDREEEAKAAITWTEDDQKNLMNLGTSELERNRRLESLIARRRSRKNMRMMAEKNLIDFDSTDLPFNVSPISTARKNPFDLPFDSNENIPGSAPSILLPRRNPFDLPYDSSEEKPDLVGDTFQQDSITFQPKEPFFRRHESFNVGPSIFGAFRQEKQDIKLRPYFIPERTTSEETNFSFLQRQSSELSESKVSSVPETESICSAGDVEDKKLIDEDFPQETGLISPTVHPSLHVGHGSESSEDVDYVELVQVEKRDVERREIVIKLGGEDNHQETESNLFETASAANPVELNTNVVDLNMEAVEQKNSSRSSSSSYSDVDEKIFAEKEEGLSSFEQSGANLIEEPGVSMQQKEPIYDLSPTSSFKKNLSSSSVSSDLPVEVSDTGFSPVIVKERESEASILSIEEHNPSNEETILESSELHAVDDDKLASREVTDINQASILESSELHAVDENKSSDQEASSDTSVEEDLLHKDESFRHELGPNFNADIHVVTHQGVDETVEFLASSLKFESTEDRSLGVPDEEQSLVVEQISLSHPTTSSIETEAIEENLTDKEVALRHEQDQVHPSNGDCDFHAGIYEEADEKELPLSDISMNPSSDVAKELLQEPLIIERESIDDVSTSHILKVSEAQAIPSEDTETELPPGLAALKDSILDGLENGDETQDLETTASHVTVENNIEEEDEIKEIDEGLLSELDAVGDFSVNDSSLYLNEIVKHSVSAEESFLVSHENETNPFKVVEEDSIVHETKVSPLEIEEEISKYEDEMVDASEPQVSRKRSIEHDDSSIREFEDPIDFKAANDEAEPADLGVKQNPVVEMHAVEDIEPSFEKAEPVSVESEVGQVEAQINPVMHVLEARSLEDIDSVETEAGQVEKVKPVAVETEVGRVEKVEPVAVETEVGQVEKPVAVETEVGQVEKVEPVAVETDVGQVEAVINPVMHVLEARSLEDIDSAFKQVSEKEIEKPIVVESSQAELIQEETETKCSENDTIHSGSNLTQNKLESPVIESRSIEDTSVSLNQVSEANTEKLVKPDPEDGLAKFETNEAGSSSKDIESDANESRAQETSTDAAEKVEDEVKGEKKKSRELGSSSSSSYSSSSSSSDSDKE